jgi:hypothetical protein
MAPLRPHSCRSIWDTAHYCESLALQWSGSKWPYIPCFFISAAVLRPRAGEEAFRNGLPRPPGPWVSQRVGICDILPQCLFVFSKIRRSGPMRDMTVFTDNLY